MNITVLCTTVNSIYKDLGLDCYDIKRNTRTYTGNNPVICHPPCRGWTRFGKAMKAKPLPGEKDLAYFCLERVLNNGGVLEHPIESDFAIYGSKVPGIKSIIVDQSWFGFWCRKRTTLLIPDHYMVPEYPFLLTAHATRERAYRDWANKDSNKTNLKFAQWLINLIEINYD